MIYTLGAKLFSLDATKLCLGNYAHLKLWRSDGTGGSTETYGTIDFIFVEGKHMFVWAPVK